MTQTTHIPVLPLTADSFAPYGRVLEPAGSRDAGRDGYDIWVQPFASEAAPRLQLVRYHARPMVVALIERHLHVTEARLPLAGQDAIIVVAAASDAPPAPRDLRAFRLGGRGVMFHRATWHAIDAYPAEAAHADFLFLSEQATVDELFIHKDRPPLRTQVHDYAKAGQTVLIDAAP